MMQLGSKNTKKLLLIIVFTSIIFWCGQYILPIAKFILYVLGVFTPLILGFCIAFVLNILMSSIENVWDKLIKKSNVSANLKRPICLILTFVVLIVFLFVILFMVVPEISNTLNLVVEMMPEHLKNLEKSIEDFNMKHRFINSLIPDIDIDKVNKTISQIFSSEGKSFFNSTLSFTTSIFSGLTNVVLGLVFSIYMLLQRDTLINQVKNVVYAFVSKDKTKSLIHITRLSSKVFSKFVTGQLLEAFIIGFLCFVGMSILKMPYATMISTLVGFTALIPVVGAFIGTGVGAFLILMISPIKALWFIVFILVLQQFEGNLIYPKVVGKSVGLPGIWVLAAVAIGGSLGGVTGMLLSVPLCSIIYTLLKEEVRKRLGKNEIESNE